MSVLLWVLAAERLRDASKGQSLRRTMTMMMTTTMMMRMMIDGGGGGEGGGGDVGVGVGFGGCKTA